MTWRPTRAARIGGALFLIVFGATAAGFLIAAIHEVVAGEPPDLRTDLVVAALFAGMAAAGWAGALRPSITLDGEEVVVRNPIRTTTVPVGDITNVEASYGGIRIGRANDTPVIAWSVQKSNLAIWFNRRTRADDVAAALREAAHL
ncbi:MAG: hypothetical protein JWN67_758 [Actinomycetia bacterium]|nr:hypothetical protein [Actinomycetes bacterium]